MPETFSLLISLCSSSILLYYKFFERERERESTSIIFSQQILRDKLLLAITCGQKSNFSGESRLEPITACHIKLVIKLL